MDPAAAAEDVRRASKRCRRLNRKTIYAYVQRGLIPYVRIESNIRFSERGHALAGRAQLPAPTGAWKGRQAPMKNSAAGKIDTGSRRE